MKSLLTYPCTFMIFIACYVTNDQKENYLEYWISQRIRRNNEFGTAINHLSP